MGIIKGVIKGDGVQGNRPSRICSRRIFLLSCLRSAVDGGGVGRGSKKRGGLDQWLGTNRMHGFPL